MRDGGWDYRHVVWGPVLGQMVSIVVRRKQHRWAGSLCHKRTKEGMRCDTQERLRYKFDNPELSYSFSCTDTFFFFISATLRLKELFTTSTVSDSSAGWGHCCCSRETTRQSTLSSLVFQLCRQCFLWKSIGTASAISASYCRLDYTVF